mmetsp:Transcript_63787/g.181153  ORF Transcript_63787/g.181153 Transcript_63787/m.181153 type:complete len:280 (-) Transcript_63787:1266-2105(-)
MELACTTGGDSPSAKELAGIAMGQVAPVVSGAVAFRIVRRLSRAKRLSVAATEDCRVRHASSFAYGTFRVAVLWGTLPPLAACSPFPQRRRSTGAAACTSQLGALAAMRLSRPAKHLATPNSQRSSCRSRSPSSSLASRACRLAQSSSCSGRNSRGSGPADAEGRGGLPGPPLSRPAATAGGPALAPGSAEAAATPAPSSGPQAPPHRASCSISSVLMVLDPDASWVPSTWPPPAASADTTSLGRGSTTAGMLRGARNPIAGAEVPPRGNGGGRTRSAG